MSDIACPGDLLGSQSEFLSGPGTYLRNAFIHASVCGKKLATPLKLVAEEEGATAQFPEDEVCLCILFLNKLVPVQCPTLVEPACSLSFLSPPKCHLHVLLFP